MTAGINISVYKKTLSNKLKNVLTQLRLYNSFEPISKKADGKNSK